MNKKKVLLDLRNLKNPTYGFGQIALNYAKHFSEIELPDIQFVFLVPDNCNMDFGEIVEVVRFDKRMKHNKNVLPKVDLWHSVNQFQTLQRIDSTTKFVFTIHDLNFLREKNWLRQLKHKFRLNRRIKKANAVTAISMFVAKEIEENLKLHGKKPIVIYDAVERIDKKPQKMPAFIDQSKPFFFSIGQIRMKKNFHLLLDVMKHFPDYNLYVCGDDHFDAAKLIRKRINDEKISNVKLTGKISDEERIWLYAHCQALLFPSQGEGFGLPVIEAMQFGKAVFVAPYTCLPEISGGFAIIWKDVNTSTMVESIKKNLPKFYNDTERIKFMKDYAYSFSYEQHIQKYIELYQDVLSEN